MARKDIDLSFILHGRQRICERRSSVIFLFLKYGPYCLDYICPGTISIEGAQLLSGRVLDLRPRGYRFEPHRHHCVVVLEQDTFILA